MAALPRLKKFPLEVQNVSSQFWWGFFSPSRSMATLMLSSGLISFYIPHVEKPLYTRISPTTCFSPVLSAFVGISKVLPKPAVHQPRQLAAPFSNKTASFYSFLKTAISLKPEDAVTCDSEEEEGLFLLL